MASLRFLKQGRGFGLRFFATPFEAQGNLRMTERDRMAEGTGMTEEAEWQRERNDAGAGMRLGRSREEAA